MVITVLAFEPAVISEDGLYRYVLRRVWVENTQSQVWIMLNPSTADATNDDPTIRRCMSFSRAWGFGGIIVVNLFALRATDPKALRIHADPIGPDNDYYLESLTYGKRMNMAAWGAHTGANERARSLIASGHLPDKMLKCLGTTKDGSPRHPLYVKSSTIPAPWS